MANRFSLSADIQPTVDKQAAQREAGDLANTFEKEIGDLQTSFDMDTGGMGGGTIGGAGGGGGGISAGAAASAGGLATRLGGLGAMSAAAPVALAGAVGFGLLQGIQKLSRASPALQQTNQMFGEAMSLFFRPFGNFLSGVLRPWATAALNMAIQFNDVYSKEGLSVAMVSLSSDVEQSWASAVGDNVEGALGTVGIDANIGGSISNFLRDVRWTRVLTSGPGAVPAAVGNAAGDAIGRWIRNSFPTISSGDVLNSIGFPTLTGGSILGSIGWPTVTAGALLGMATWPTVGGGLVMSTLFGSVSISTQDVLDEILGGGSGTGGGGTGGGGSGDAWWEDFAPETRPGGGGGGGGTGDADINDDGIIDRLDTLIQESRQTQQAIEDVMAETIREDAREETLDPF